MTIISLVVGSDFVLYSSSTFSLTTLRRWHRLYQSPMRSTWVHICSYRSGKTFVLAFQDGTVIQQGLVKFAQRFWGYAFGSILDLLKCFLRLSNKTWTGDPVASTSMPSMGPIASTSMSSTFCPSFWLPDRLSSASSIVLVTTFNIDLLSSSFSWLVFGAIVVFQLFFCSVCPFAVTRLGFK